jgi:hypothetical protein
MKPKHYRYAFGLVLLSGILTAPQTAYAQSQLLQNANFESWTGQVTNNWWTNSWGSAASTKESTTGRSGLGVKLTVSSIPAGGGILFRQDYNFLKGRYYTGSVWMKSSGSLKVQILLRQNSAPYTSFGAKTLNVGTNWTQVSMSGGFDSDQAGCFGIQVKGTGTLYIDDASMTEYAAPYAGIGTETIPATFFGTHSNRYGNVGYTSWKAHQTNNGMLRMWDTDTVWGALEPKNNVWVWSRLDGYVNAARAANPNIKIILVLGQTPKWAVANTADHRDSPYHIPTYIPEVPIDVRGQKILSNSPDNISDWKDYVKAVANRYAGKIQYVEVWNEANVGIFFSGTLTQLKDLEAATKAALTEVGSSIQVISPSWTDYGLVNAEEYFSLGGGQNADILGWHWYQGLTPEDRVPLIDGARKTANSWGLSSKPIWNTEGAASGTSAPTDNASRAAVARGFITQWAGGARNWNYYGYDIDTTNRVKLSVNNNQDLSAGGIAMREVGRWLVGSQMTNKWVDSSGFWTIQLQRPNGYVGRIIWSAPNNSFNWTIPTGWGVTGGRRLDGTTFTASDNSQVRVSGVPILLENQNTTLSTPSVSASYQGS